MAKPQKTTRESEQKEICDALVESAAFQMQKAGAPLGMIIDRLLTYAAAQACVDCGSPNTANHFRKLADNIEGGVFHSITGEAARH